MEPDYTEEIENQLLAEIAGLLRENPRPGGSLGSGALGLPLVATLEEAAGETALPVQELIATRTALYNERAARAGQPLLPDPELSTRRIFDRLLRFGKLTPLLDDPRIEEIEINAPDCVFVVLRDGHKRRLRLSFNGDEEVLLLVKRLAALQGRHIDEASPLLNLQIPGGHRLNVAIPEITPHVVVTIRKHTGSVMGLEELVRLGTLPGPSARFLAAAVKARLNILVCGGTSCGKTTLLNSLAAAIPAGDRVVVVEETAELMVHRVVEDVVTMQVRHPNIEGRGGIELWDLVRNALRQRPRWIIVGEILGREALVTLLSLTSGHSGLCTLHADDPYSAIERLGTLAGLAPESPDEARLNSLISRAFQLVVHLRLDPAGGRRRLTGIAEVAGREGSRVLLNPLFETVEEAGGEEHLHWSGTLPRCLRKLEQAGLSWERDVMAGEARA
jgi:pilus assembly protein CpaF